MYWTGFSAILGSVLVACNNHSFLTHRSMIDCTGFGFRLWVGSRFAQCASHVILLVDGKLTKSVYSQGVSGLDQELTGCHFHSYIIGHIIKWPRPRSVDKRKVFPHYSSFHSKNREKDTIDLRQNTLWHTSPKYWIPDWVQFLTVFISSVVWFSCLMSIQTPLKKMVTSENRQQAKWIGLQEYWETIGSVGNMIPFLKPWRPWKAASIVCSEDSRRTYSLYPW